jgi:hypothetical protein
MTHTDEHAHGHGHSHDHGSHGSHDPTGGAVESYDHVHGGMPVLDIGGDIGALVVTMPAESVGQELFLRSESAPALHVHTGVWRRDVGPRVIAAAVFLELVEGAYWILDDSAGDVSRVEIIGGKLTEVDLTR